MSDGLRILLLCDDRKGHANTVLDHIDAFRRYSRHRVATFNPVGMRDSALLDLSGFDVVVVHYSLILSSAQYVSAAFKDKLRRFQGLKVQFVQDEYRWVDRATSAMRDIGVHVLFTCAPEPQAAQLYDGRLPGVRRVPTLTGYVPESLETHPVRPHAQRPLDVGYRGRVLPYWLGRLTQEKTWIGEGFLERAGVHGLTVDIAWRERDRMYGQRWIDFISSCRATLGTESGASIADFDGAVEKAVTAFLRQRPEATFDEVSKAVLEPYEGNVVVNVISPRVFEAAALGTALVMFPGAYSGIAAPGEHYIALEKDFSNMADVAAQLRDRAAVEALAGRARRDLIASRRWSYQSFVAGFDRVVEEEARPTARTRRRTLALARVERALRVPPPHIRALQAAAVAVGAITHKDLPIADDYRVLPFLTKGMLAVRYPMADPWARRVYRLGRKLGLPRKEVLEEMLKLSLLRSAARRDPNVTPVFDIETHAESGGRLRFVSAAAGAGARNGGDSRGLDTVQAIEWDHSAIGTTVRLRRPPVQIGVGVDGVQRFPAISTIFRAEPGLLDEMITGADSSPRVQLRSGRT